MKRILKHKLPVELEFTLQLHEGFSIIKVDVIGDGVCLWAVEDESRPLTGVNFRVVRTGEEFEMPSVYSYLDTFIVCEGAFVGHLFMETAFGIRVDNNGAESLEGRMIQ